MIVSFNGKAKTSCDNLPKLLQQNCPNEVPFANLLFKVHWIEVYQYLDWSLPTPEVRSLNPVISKFYIELLLTKTCI